MAGGDGRACRELEKRGGAETGEGTCAGAERPQVRTHRVCSQGSGAVGADSGGREGVGSPQPCDPGVLQGMRRPEFLERVFAGSVVRCGFMWVPVPEQPLLETLLVGDPRRPAPLLSLWSWFLASLSLFFGLWGQFEFKGI